MARRYSIRFVESAARSLKKLPAGPRLRIAARIEALADNPYPPGTRKMAGEEHAYRIRIGDYRVVYDVLDDAIIVLVLRIGHRKDVYRS
ncbi:MAG: type II toxin-antitoxin system RelE/ParE family toxin [Candidatus Korobacteraceae bacterium]